MYPVCCDKYLQTLNINLFVVLNLELLLSAHRPLTFNTKLEAQFPEEIFQLELNLMERSVL